MLFTSFDNWRHFLLPSHCFSLLPFCRLCSLQISPPGSVISALLSSSLYFVDNFLLLSLSRGGKRGTKTISNALIYSLTLLTHTPRAFRGCSTSDPASQRYRSLSPTTMCTMLNFAKRRVLLLFLEGNICCWSFLFSPSPLNPFVLVSSSFLSLFNASCRCLLSLLPPRDR